jgi:uracil-DNA glycosylase
MNLILPEPWKPYLQSETQKPYFKDLERALRLAYKKRLIYPQKENVFQAFSLTPLNKIKVVILGQDPYHGEGQAHGLSFSVPEKVPIPPSLRNIYKEIISDTGRLQPGSANLEYLATQGVFLLNSTLTVEASEAGSHQGWGWEIFTDEIIKVISTEQEHVVFLLWGKYAQNKESLIDESKHLILKAAHPSPLSAHRGFIGCKHFSQTNTYLKNYSIKEIEW